jgi:SAM-dependent methyltransferase
MGSNGPEDSVKSVGPSRSDAAEAWMQLAPDYERARSRDDSLDRLVEWPAERDCLGDITGQSVLDLGCGNGTKLAELVRAGAGASVGVDISGNFITDRPSGLELVQGDMSELDSVAALAGRRFDRIMFLQSFGYASDPVRTLRAARTILTDDGFILLTRSQPIRYALERAERNGTSFGEEYFSRGVFSYRSSWSDQVTLSKVPYTMSDLLNVFSAAGLWIETTVEPQMSEDVGRRYPEKQDWMNKYLGILIFVLRSLPDHLDLKTERSHD